ncbi:putative uncharacterized protein DDB_G0282133 isoform X2 [Solanum pennellii]|uniref:BHLH domain-containing protein n=1 Tax=Solanum pennellii TaxID=28526 RepID=A0ABM1UY07_SOLPN|nr:putative uncharacterized protein DDB_G0282133 isoform X2 [Solanum pennellii]
MSSEKSILEYSNLANNNNPNCYLMSQNWWSQVDNNTIFHPISTNSSLSSCNTNRSSSCEEDVISISNNNNNNGNSVTNNNNNNNLHQYQFLLGVDEINNSSLISGENIAANSHDHNQHIWSQLLLSNSTTSGTSGSINTKNLLENNMEMSLLDNGSTTTLITSKSCFNHNQLANNHDDDDDYTFHPYSNLLGRPLNYYTNNNNDDDMDSMFPMRSDQIAHHQEVDNSRNLASICFGDYLNNKPLVDFKPSLKTLNLGQHKKNGLQQPYISKSRVTLSTCNTLKRSNGRSQEYNNPIDGKKRKLEDNLETNSKGQKNENSVVTSAKTQVPKVKLADKVTALQQIVSPFGKTDTASVLWETINYVRFLQEQIQLLSHAYMKSNTCKVLGRI